MPFLLAEAFASNIGGAATLVGDPPNIIIASRADLTFTDFLIHMTPVVVVILAAFLVLALWMFRADLRANPEHAEALAAMDERLRDHRPADAGRLRGGPGRDRRSGSCSSARPGCPPRWWPCSAPGC